MEEYEEIITRLDDMRRQREYPLFHFEGDTDVDELYEPDEEEEKDEEEVGAEEDLDDG